MTANSKHGVLYRVVDPGLLAAACAANMLAACSLPFAVSGGLAHGYEHAQPLGEALRSRPRPAARDDKPARELTGRSVGAANHPAAGLIPDEPGTGGVAAVLLLHPSGSRSLTVGVEAAGPLAECGYHGGGLLVQGMFGWSILPLPDEAPLGGEVMLLLGGSGIAAREECQNGFFAGARLGAPLRISRARASFELGADAHPGPVFYLVPELDLVRYITPEPGASPRTALAFSATLGLRVLFWSPVEP